MFYVALCGICVTLPIPVSATDVLPIGIESMTYCQLAKPPSDTLPTMRLFANWQKIVSSQVTAVDILSVCKRCR